jgi:sulfotransferase family protein
MSPSFPFVVGCGRSGTTLVQAILDSHPDMAVPLETKFIVGLAKRRRKYETRLGFAVDVFVADLVGYNNLVWRMSLSSKEILNDLSLNPPADYPEAVRRVFALHALQKGKSRYANKTPVHALSIPTIAGLFPEAQFIHIIRDGRDVALSYLDFPSGPTSVVSGALHWKRHVKRARAAGVNIGPNRYQETKYEELVSDPEGAVRRLCDFIDLPFNPVMLRYYDRAEEVLARVPSKFGHERLSSPPGQGRHHWRTQMPEPDLNLFEAVAGTLLDELGYQRAVPRPSVRTRLGGHLAAAGEAIERGRHALSNRLRIVFP